MGGVPTQDLGKISDHQSSNYVFFEYNHHHKLSSANQELN